MTEEEAKAWLVEQLDVSRETMALLERFAKLVLDEARHQNLIAASTAPHIFARHIVDSAQLLPLAEDAPDGDWMDLGSGPGFPGIVIALLSRRPVVLVESRRKRVEFLQRAVSLLGLDARVTIEGRRLELVGDRPVAIISARAFAPLERLLTLAHRFSRSGTVWVLPKGQNAQSELAAVQKTWQGVFHVKQSVTDPNSSIVLARNVRRSRP